MSKGFEKSKTSSLLWYSCMRTFSGSITLSFTVQIESPLQFTQWDEYTTETKKFVIHKREISSFKGINHFTSELSCVPRALGFVGEFSHPLTFIIGCSFCRRLVVFQHIPWFIQFIDEKEDPYFSLKSSLRKKWLDKFKDAGVEAIFCGHLHRNAGGEYRGMQVVVTSAIGGQLGNDKSGARIVKVLEDKINHKYYAIEDLPMKNWTTTFTILKHYYI